MEETGWSALSRFWAAGGWWMYPMLVLGLLAFALSMGLPLVALVTGKRFLARFGMIALLGLASLVLLVGVLGFLKGIADIEEALPSVNPADYEVIRLSCHHEMRTRLVFGLMMAILPAAGGTSLIPQALAREPMSLSRRIVGLVPALLVAVALAGVTTWQLGVRADEKAAAQALNPS